MPIHKVKGGYKWGGHGKTYPTRKGAEKQAAAAHANGFTEEVVTETLSKSATVKDWIDDFIKSKDPKFKNDSRKQRIRRAVAAYYGKQNEERALDEARINEATLKPGDRVVATKNSNGGFPAGRRTIPMVLKGHRGTYRGLEQGLDKPYHHIEWDHIGASDPMYHTPSEFKKA